MPQENEIRGAELVELMERGPSGPNEQHRKINIQEVKDVFQKRNFRRGFSIFDENKDGVIDILELKQMIHELGNQIPTDVVRKILMMSDRDNDGYLNYKEFVQMVENPQLKVLFGRYLHSYVKTLVPERTPKARRSEIDGIFDDEYSCWPPPVWMLIISVIEIIFFSIDMFSYDATEGNGPIASKLMHNPYRRYEIWRFVTYMFVHVGYMHLFVNVFVQILLGIPLEMVHRGWRVLVIYFAGVIAGSLATSITDPSVYLAGASGGVYAIITAHIASVILNWKEMSVPIVQLILFLVLTVADFGQAIYSRYYLQVKDNIGFEAHVAGAIVGLLVGIFILRNLEVNSCEKHLWWACLFSFIVLNLGAIIWNIAYPSYFPPSR